MRNVLYPMPTEQFLRGLDDGRRRRISRSLPLLHVDDIRALGGPIVPVVGGQAVAFDQRPRHPSGGGGLVSTTMDYGRFLQMLANGGELDGVRLLSPKTVSLMTMNHLPGGREMTEMMPSTTMFNESGYSGVGFGLSVAVMHFTGRGWSTI